VTYLLLGQIEGQYVQHEIKDGKFRVGRSFDNEITLKDKAISRYHALIIVEGKKVSIRDLNSANGTWINSQQIYKTTVIQPGDRIKFGKPELTLHYEDTEDVDSSSTMIILSDSDKIYTEDAIKFDEIYEQFDPTSSVNQALFRAVTEAGKLLIGSRPLNDMFEKVLDIVEGVVTARRILLLMGDSPDKTPEVRAARPTTQTDNEELILSKTIINSVFNDRKALLLTDAMNDPRFQMHESIILQNLRSAMVAPLFDNQEIIGMLYADSDDRRVQYDRHQLQAFTLLANLVAVKITNTQLLEDQREKERMGQEMEIAAKVQQSLLSSPPPIPGYDILAWQISCLDVSGDLYDVEHLYDGRTALVLGDVTGKGMPAALLMSNVIASLRVLYQEIPKIDVLAKRLNKQLLQSSDDMHYVTLFLGFLDPTTGRLEYINAGHNPPIVVHKDGRIEELPSTGFPIGIINDAIFETCVVEISDASLVAIYSDGIIEAMFEGEQFGKKRFVRNIKEKRLKPLEEIRDGLHSDLKVFMGETSFNDDITLLLIRRKEYR
jgi:sigma-B regulation protein RsbU (phosphoserine phosphatase)